MTGVILFRAQPFHNGHLAQIARAYNDMKKLDGDLYVLVGSADKSGTKRNPLPIDLRLDLVKRSLEEVYDVDDLYHIHVVPLKDLSDEANNTHSWGTYLYNKMCEITEDGDFVFYYSDRPEIALSWFDDATCEHIWFKFLSRVAEMVSATYIRCLLADLNSEHVYFLKKSVPSYVYSKASELHEYIVNAR